MSDSGIVAFALLTAVSLWCFGFFAYRWFSLSTWSTSWLLLAALTVVVFPMLLSHLGRWFLVPFMRRPKPLVPEDGLRVAAVTSFVAAGESLAMLERTLKALVAMEYPHDVWLLDEEDCEEARDLCLRLGVNHFTRCGRPKYQRPSGEFESQSKHGNYNAWLDAVGFERYDILAAFDPDHRPQGTFLSSVLGYFRDSETAWVQLPQAYSNQDANWRARGAAEETYSFHSSVLMASYGLGFVTMIGSHNTHRMSALEQSGGFSSHEADDLLTALNYQERGWKGVYLPEIRVRGLTPETWSGYLNQQRRWARSVLDIKLRRFPSASTVIEARSKLIGFCHGLGYLYYGLGIPGFALILAYMLLTGAESQELVAQLAVPALMLFVSSCLLGLFLQQFFLDPAERGVPWRVGLLRIAKWPYFLAAVWDAVLDRRVKYVLTPKKAAAEGAAGWAWPHLTLAVVVVTAALLGAYSGNPPSGLAMAFAVPLASVSVFVAASVLSAGRRVFRTDGMMKDPSKSTSSRS